MDYVLMSGGPQGASCNGGSDEKSENRLRFTFEDSESN